MTQEPVLAIGYQIEIAGRMRTVTAIHNGTIEVKDNERGNTMLVPFKLAEEICFE